MRVKNVTKWIQATSGEENHQCHSNQRKGLWGLMLWAPFLPNLLEFSFGVSTFWSFLPLIKILLVNDSNHVYKWNDLVIWTLEHSLYFSQVSWYRPDLVFLLIPLYNCFSFSLFISCGFYWLHSLFIIHNLNSNGLCFLFFIWQDSPCKEIFLQNKLSDPILVLSFTLPRFSNEF